MSEKEPKNRNEIEDLVGGRIAFDALKAEILAGLQENNSHKMYVRSPQDNLGDTFGQLIFVNGINQEEYLFDVMKDEEIDLEDGELYNSIFLSNIVDFLDLQNKEKALDKLGDALEQTTLQHLMSEKEFTRVMSKIIDFEMNQVAFLQEVPYTQHTMNLNYLLMDEEITRMIHLVLEKCLIKKDIVDFGKLIVLRNIPLEELHFGRLGYFEVPFNNALKNKVVTTSEQLLIKVAMTALKLR